jgi:hypothetical protein
VIAPGEAAPNPLVWLAPRQPVRLHELAPRGEGLLVVFYLFDWSAT